MHHAARRGISRPRPDRRLAAKRTRPNLGGQSPERRRSVAGDRALAYWATLRDVAMWRMMTLERTSFNGLPHQR